MENICYKCYLNPNAHSFKILSGNEKKNIFNKYINNLIDVDDKTIIFYTCPSDAIEYNDSDGILLHYENMLKKNGNKDWIWIFNCNNLDIKHSLEFNTAKRIAQLVSTKYMHNIKKIYVINSNYVINIILNFVWPFLNDKLKNLIIMK